MITAALYGESVLSVFLRLKNHNLKELRIPQYDDIWLANTLTLHERELLLKKGSNNLMVMENIYKKDQKFRRLITNVIESEGEKNCILESFKYLKENYKNFNDMPYLSDLIYLFTSFINNK